MLCYYKKEIPALKNVVVHVLGLGITTDKNLFNNVCFDVLKRIEKWEHDLVEFCKKYFNTQLKSTNKIELKTELVELGFFKDKKEVKQFINMIV